VCLPQNRSILTNVKPEMLEQILLCLKIRLEKGLFLLFNSIPKWNLRDLWKNETGSTYNTNAPGRGEAVSPSVLFQMCGVPGKHSPATWHPWNALIARGMNLGRKKCPKEELSQGPWVQALCYSCHLCPEARMCMGCALQSYKVVNRPTKVKVILVWTFLVMCP
jgi:hypothetical protein